MQSQLILNDLACKMATEANIPEDESASKSIPEEGFSMTENKSSMELSPSKKSPAEYTCKSQHCQQVDEIENPTSTKLSEDEKQHQTGVVSNNVETGGDKVEAINETEIEESTYHTEKDGAEVSRQVRAEEPMTDQYKYSEVMAETTRKGMIASQENENARAKGEEDADLESIKQPTSTPETNMGLINEAPLPKLDLTTKSQGEEDERADKSCATDEARDPAMHVEDGVKELSLDGVQKKKEDMPFLVVGECKDPESIGSSDKLEHADNKEDACTMNVEGAWFDADLKLGDNVDGKLENPYSDQVTDGVSTEVTTEASETLNEVASTVCRDKIKDISEDSMTNLEKHHEEKRDSQLKNGQEDRLAQQATLIPEETEIAPSRENVEKRVEQNILPVEEYEGIGEKDEPNSGETSFSTEKISPLAESITKIKGEENVIPQKIADGLNSTDASAGETGQPYNTGEFPKTEAREKHQELSEFCSKNNKRDESLSETQTTENLVVKVKEMDSEVMVTRETMTKLTKDIEKLQKVPDSHFEDERGIKGDEKIISETRTVEEEAIIKQLIATESVTEDEDPSRLPTLDSAKDETIGQSSHEERVDGEITLIGKSESPRPKDEVEERKKTTGPKEGYSTATHLNNNPNECSSAESKSSADSSSLDKSPTKNISDSEHQILTKSENERQDQNRVEATEDKILEEHHHDIEDDNAKISKLASIEEPNPKVHEEETSINNNYLDQHLELITDQHAIFQVILVSTEKEMITSQNNENTTPKRDEDADLECNQQATCISESCINNEDIDNTMHVEDELKEIISTVLQNEKEGQVREVDWKDPESIRSSDKSQHENNEEFKFMTSGVKGASTVTVAPSPYNHGVEETTFEAPSNNEDDDEEKLQNPFSGLVANEENTHVAIEAGETMQDASNATCQDNNQKICESVKQKIDVTPVDDTAKSEDLACPNRDIKGEHEEKIIQTGLPDNNEDGKINPETHDGEKRDLNCKNEQELEVGEQAHLILENTESEEPTSAPNTMGTSISTDKSLSLIESVLEISNEERIFPQQIANNLNTNHPLVEETEQPESGDIVSKTDIAEERQESSKFCVEYNKQHEHHPKIQGIENLIIKQVDTIVTKETVLESMKDVKEIKKFRLSYSEEKIDVKKDEKITPGESKEMEEVIDKQSHETAKDDRENPSSNPVIDGASPQVAIEAVETLQEASYAASKDKNKDTCESGGPEENVPPVDRDAKGANKEDISQAGLTEINEDSRINLETHDVENRESLLKNDQEYELGKQAILIAEKTEEEAQGENAEKRIEQNTCSVEQDKDEPTSSPDSGEILISTEKSLPLAESTKKINSEATILPRNIASDLNTKDLFVEDSGKFDVDETGEETETEAQEKFEGSRKTCTENDKQDEQHSETQSTEILVTEHMQSEEMVMANTIIKSTKEIEELDSVPDSLSQEKIDIKGDDKIVTEEPKEMEETPGAYESEALSRLPKTASVGQEKIEHCFQEESPKDGAAMTDKNKSCIPEDDTEKGKKAVEAFDLPKTNSRQDISEKQVIEESVEETMKSSQNDEMKIQTLREDTGGEIEGRSSVLSLPSGLMEVSEPSETQVSALKPEEREMESTARTLPSATVGMDARKEDMEEVECDQTKIKEEVEATESEGKIEATSSIEDHDVLTIEENNTLVKSPSSILGVPKKDSSSTNNSKAQFLRLVNENTAMKEVKPVDVDHLEGSNSAQGMMDVTANETKSNCLGGDIAERQEAETNSENRNVEVKEVIDQEEQISDDVNEKDLITCINHEIELTLTDNQLVHAEDGKSSIDVTNTLLQEEELSKMTEDSSAITGAEREAPKLKTATSSSPEEYLNTKSGELLIEKGDFVANDQSEEMLLRSDNIQTEENDNNLQDQDSRSVQEVPASNLEPRSNHEEFLNSSLDQEGNINAIKFTHEVCQRSGIADNNESVKEYATEGKITSPGEETENEVEVSTSKLLEQTESTKSTEGEKPLTLNNQTEQNMEITCLSALKSSDASKTNIDDPSSAAKVYDKETEASFMKKDDAATDVPKIVPVIIEIEEAGLKNPRTGHIECDTDSVIVSKNEGETPNTTDKTTSDSIDIIGREEENFSSEKEEILEEQNEGKLKFDSCVRETDKTTTVQHQREQSISTIPTSLDYPTPLAEEKATMGNAEVHPTDAISTGEEIIDEAAETYLVHSIENTLPEKEHETVKLAGTSDLEFVNVTKECSNADSPLLKNEVNEEKVSIEAFECTTNSTREDSETVQGQDDKDKTLDGSLTGVTIEKAETALENEPIDELPPQKIVEAADTNEQVELVSESTAEDQRDEKIYEAKEQSICEDNVPESRENVPNENFQRGTQREGDMQFEIEHHTSVPEDTDAIMLGGCAENQVPATTKMTNGSKNILEQSPEPTSSLKESDTLTTCSETFNKDTAPNSGVTEQGGGMDLGRKENLDLGESYKGKRRLLFYYHKNV
ncbi:titin isoform X2 [Neltuma alba]|uniref:titin isoform X2 n=1 Tax=Neltuma alba TaxID=207710 RepID=UPI0010A2D045|nr:titin-like isoform X2 [Prosopis alba]